MQTLKNYLFIGGYCAVALLFIKLSYWQAERFQQESLELEMHEDASALPAQDITKNEEENQPLRPALLSGDIQKTIYLLDNWPHQGKPGVLLVLPVSIGEKVYLVASGWLPASADRLSLKQQAAELLQTQVPSMVNTLEAIPWHTNLVTAADDFLWESDGSVHLLQRLDLERISNSLPGNSSVAPALYWAQSAVIADVKQVPHPANTINPDKNRGYSWQWFSFFLIWLIGGLAYLYRSQGTSIMALVVLVVPSVTYLTADIAARLANKSEGSIGETAVFFDTQAQPVLKIADKITASDKVDQNQWILLVSNDRSCNYGVDSNRLKALKQMHVALHRRAKDVVYMNVNVGEHSPALNADQHDNLEFPSITVDNCLPLPQSWPGQAASNNLVWLVDPAGNYVMTFYESTSEASILTDVKKILRLNSDRIYKNLSE